MKISCFHTDDLDKTSNEKPLIETGVMDKVFNIIEDRKKDMGMENSYTSSLFKEGLNKILDKIKEESNESIEASLIKDHTNIVYEYTDLLYHMMVALSYHDIKIEEIFSELERRIEKKKKRLYFG